MHSLQVYLICFAFFVQPSQHAHRGIERQALGLTPEASFAHGDKLSIKVQVKSVKKEHMTSSTHFTQFSIITYIQYTCTDVDPLYRLDCEIQHVAADQQAGFSRSRVSHAVHTEWPSAYSVLVVQVFEIQRFNHFSATHM